MADLDENPFLLEEAKRAPVPEEYEPQTEEYTGLDDSNASVEQMELESGIDFGAIDWAHGAIPSIGQVDPGTMPQLTSGCQGMSVTS